MVSTASYAMEAILNVPEVVISLKSAFIVISTPVLVETVELNQSKVTPVVVRFFVLLATPST